MTMYKLAGLRVEPCICEKRISRGDHFLSLFQRMTACIPQLTLGSALSV